SYMGAAASKVSPLLVAGSYVGWLTAILRHLTGRFHQWRLEPLADEEALEAVYNYAHTYQVPITDDTAPYLAEVCFNDPFYIAATIRNLPREKDLTTREGVLDALAFETVPGKGEIAQVWMEYLWPAFDKVNDKNAQRIVLYLAAHEPEERGRDRGPRTGADRPGARRAPAQAGPCGHPDSRYFQLPLPRTGRPDLRHGFPPGLRRGDRTGQHGEDGERLQARGRLGPPSGRVAQGVSAGASSRAAAGRPHPASGSRRRSRTGGRRGSSVGMPSALEDGDVAGVPRHYIRAAGCLWTPPEDGRCEVTPSKRRHSSRSSGNPATTAILDSPLARCRMRAPRSTKTRTRRSTWLE
ncbi:MAG: hypothetical protein GY856_43790, partial [bacterium]|nr:hypothetical protein [bacterium]